MRNLRPAWVASVFALGACVGCSQSSPHPPVIGDCQGPGCVVGGSSIQRSGPPPSNGSPDAADGAEGRACGTLARPDAVCEACLEQSCCTPALVCSNNADCAALTRCIGFCQPTDLPCIAGCQNTHLVGQPNYNDFVSCLSINCAISCQLADAGASCGTLIFSIAACDACVTQSCCGASAVCAGDPDCILLAQCLQVCMPNDTNCIASCQAASPNGVGVYAALGRCVQTSCALQCQ